MSTLADLIEDYIKQRIRHSKDQMVALSRAQLAELFSCVPSQINYVLTTRFTSERGYIIESRRGGGGYIRIMQINKADQAEVAQQLLHEINDHISESSADRFLASFHELDILTREQVRLIRSVMQREIANYAQGRDTIRASLLRSILFLFMYCKEV